MGGDAREEALVELWSCKKHDHLQVRQAGRRGVAACQGPQDPKGSCHPNASGQYKPSVMINPTAAGFRSPGPAANPSHSE